LQYQIEGLMANLTNEDRQQCLRKVRSKNSR
jgi:hypothetical protein